MVSPNTRLIATKPLEDRLTESRRITDNGCWEWTRSVTEHLTKEDEMEKEAGT